MAFPAQGSGRFEPSQNGLNPTTSAMRTEQSAVTCDTGNKIESGKVCNGASQLGSHTIEVLSQLLFLVRISLANDLQVVTNNVF